MELVRAWLRALGAPADPLVDDLARLPPRDPYAAGPSAAAGATSPLSAAEWSLRSGSSTVRFAWNVDVERAAPGAVAAVLARWGGGPEVAALLPSLAGVPVQVGRDGRRAKLYVYARGAPPDTLARVEAAFGAGAAFAALPAPPGGAGPAFVAVDLPGEGAPAAVKRYLELPRADAARWLRELGAASLAAWAAALPDDLGTDPARFVVSVRVAGAARASGGAAAGAAGAGTGAGARPAWVDVTLHVKIDRSPERLAELAGPELAARAAERFRLAHRLGLRFVPTYVSRLEAPGRPVAATVYHRLEPRP